MGLQMRIGCAQCKPGKAGAYEFLVLIAPDSSAGHLPLGCVVELPGKWPGDLTGVLLVR